MQGRTRRPHGIKTRKVSISVSEEDFGILTARAERLHGGNLSAVVHEMAEIAKRDDAIDRFLAMSPEVVVTDEEVQAVLDELALPPVRAGRRKRATAA